MRELSLNRPVHLAGRDVFYDQAVKLLQGDLMNYPANDRWEKCRAITGFIQLAKEHADFAMRGMECSREEKLFLQFLVLLVDSAQALQVMTKHEHLLASDRELLRELLGQDTELIERSAVEHRQLAQNLIRETVQLIQMATTAFDKLKQKNLAEFDKDDARPRYQRAHDSFLKQRP
jgi:hypothetical protein